jgi:hypothetical protein
MPGTHFPGRELPCVVQPETEMDRAALTPAIIGPDGKMLTFADLPPPDTTRWVIRRKAMVVAAVRGGLLTLEEACERYRLSIEEYAGWQHAIETYGPAGLRATGTQRYRKPN